MGSTNKFKKYMILDLKQYELGLEMTKLIISLFNVILQKVGCIISNPLETIQIQMNQLLIHPNSIEYCMLEYLAKNKKMLLNDKLNFFEIDIQTQHLFLILDLELMTKDQDFAPWWTGYAKEKSNNLWLPKKTNSGSNYYPKSVSYMDAKSWFLTRTKKAMETPLTNLNYKKIPLQSSIPLSQEEMEKEEPNIKEKGPKLQPNSTMKIRLYPTTKQKEKLQLIFDANRWAYNTLVEKVKDRIFDKKIKKDELYKEIRPFVQKKNPNIPDRIKKVPDEVFDSAFRDLQKAVSSALALSKAQKEKTGKGFKCIELEFRSKKALSQSVEITSRSISKKDDKIRFWPRLFENENIKIKEDLPGIKYSCRIQKTRLNEYYLCIPIRDKKTPLITNKSCAIDPGVRTMLTLYDPSGEVVEIGTNIDHIIKKQLLVDKLISKLRKYKGKRNKRYNIHKEKLYIQQKIKNQMKDAHHKISNWIVDSYDNVLLPKLQTQKMSIKNYRKIGKKTVKSMQMWSHYSFFMMLKEKMKLNNKNLIECTEEYTSKACTSCGRLNHLLGGSKKFICPFSDCKLQIDRDINGSRNIFIKNIKLILQK